MFAPPTSQPVNRRFSPFLFGGHGHAGCGGFVPMPFVICDGLQTLSLGHNVGNVFNYFLCQLLYVRSVARSLTDCVDACI